MLIHYTKDVDSATSILESGQLWLKSLGKTSDNEEVLHYMREFNRYHYLGELNLILDRFLQHKNKEELSIEAVVSTIAQNKAQWLEGISYGAALADILRDHTYLICFTENEESEFHNEEYGDISFEFSDDPLVKTNVRSSIFLQEKVEYFNSHELEELQSSYQESLLSDEEIEQLNTRIEQNLDELDIDVHEFLRTWKVAASYQLYKFNRTLLPKVREWNKRFNFTKSNRFEVTQAISFLNKLMVEQRAERKTIYLKKDDHFKRKIIRDSGNYELNGQTKQNLMGCFLKDNKFIKDSETRIVAIPKNRDALVDSDWLKLPFAPSKLTRIKVSPHNPNRDEIIRRLQGVISSNGYTSCSVE
ncbi:hypothetical protein FZD47_18075 [Bacillus infantis]|uniref:Uncharacterized protein n=1 Tax=Bacillus infantis TaxID=324767 RepID=A0A5D4SK09_9BACI|nr:hypothetical protein [Bacillus infantis]TYS61996.1 hypothetical protein FZD47_18075 [Bacillus infantis]